MAYARVNGTDVVEICTPVAGFSIDQCFHPDIVAQLVPCADNVTVEWTYVDGKFVDPNAPMVEEPAPEEPAQETPPAE